MGEIKIVNSLKVPGVVFYRLRREEKTRLLGASWISERPVVQLTRPLAGGFEALGAPTHTWLTLMESARVEALCKSSHACV